MSRNRSRLIAVLAAAGALVIVGVVIGVMSQQDDTPPANSGVAALQNQAASVAALPGCADVFAPGQVINPDKASAGCKDTYGDPQAPASMRCTDGKRLWQVDGDMGTPAGFGRDGEPYAILTTTEAASDPGYKAAYNACNGIKPD